MIHPVAVTGRSGIRWTTRSSRTGRGDHPETVVFSSEPEFLIALRKFFDWETSKNEYPEKVSELVAWKLMLRLIRT